MRYQWWLRSNDTRTQMVDAMLRVALAHCRHAVVKAPDMRRARCCRHTPTGHRWSVPAWRCPHATHARPRMLDRTAAIRTGALAPRRRASARGYCLSRRPSSYTHMQASQRRPPPLRAVAAPPGWWWCVYVCAYEEGRRAQTACCRRPSHGQANGGGASLSPGALDANSSSVHGCHPSPTPGACAPAA